MEPEAAGPTRLFFGIPVKIMTVYRLKTRNFHKDFSVTSPPFEFWAAASHPPAAAGAAWAGGIPSEGGGGRRMAVGAV